MAKEKKKLKKKNEKNPIQEEKAVKEISYYDFGKFRLIRPDPLNWAIDPAKEDGSGWKQGQRMYCHKIEGALLLLFESMIGNEKGINKVKKLREEIQKAKEDILAALKTIRTDKITP